MEEKQQGFIYLWRQLLKSDTWKCDGELLKVFIWCLLKATHQSLETNKMVVERGQFFAGEKVASKELGIPTSTYRGKLKKLKELGVVETKVANRFTLITVCNYSTYQNRDLPQPVNQATIYKDNNKDNNNTIVLAEEPVVKRKLKTQPREETKPLITYYSNKYKEMFSEPYHISWAKDGKHIKQLLDSGFTATTLFKLIDMFINDKDAFLTKTGHTISVFASTINKYVGQLHSEPEKPSFDLKDLEHGSTPLEEMRPKWVEWWARKYGGKENIPDNVWRTIYPDNATNPHRKH